ncbi:hypothetical protein ACFXOI_03865 [Streptomyces bacillaris]|uniref:hypothetical protein n=1 Tax=Streptomyces bacillaris TaxID=68179 RepID=UPI0036D0A759
MIDELVVLTEFAQQEAVVGRRIARIIRASFQVEEGDERFGRRGLGDGGALHHGAFGLSRTVVGRRSACPNATSGRRSRIYGRYPLRPSGPFRVAVRPRSSAKDRWYSVCPA